MTNRERIVKTVLDSLERKLKKADDEQLAMITEDLIDCGYCAPLTSNKLRDFGEIYDFLQNEGDEVEIDGNSVECEGEMTEQEVIEDMFEELPFDKVDKAEFANTIAQETAEDIIADLKNYIAKYGHITKSMLDELIERYVSRYGVEVEDD